MNTMTPEELQAWTERMRRNPGPPAIALRQAQARKARRVERVAKESVAPPEARHGCKGDKAHHWRIAEPEGEYSEGRCRHCQKTKVFRNSSPEMGPSEWFGSAIRVKE